MLLGVYGFPQHNPVRNIFFPLDQAASEDSVVLWHQRERRQDADLDRHFGLCTGGNHKKTAETGYQPLHYFTDFGHSTV